MRSSAHPVCVSDNRKTVTFPLADPHRPPLGSFRHSQQDQLANNAEAPQIVSCERIIGATYAGNP